jgi:MFS transporter, ACS family, hexuronate transporter
MTSADPKSSTASPMTSWRWVICLLLMQATIINYMDRMALNQLANRIKLAFNLDDEQYGMLESAFSVAFGLGAICVGYIVDRVSVRWVYPFMVLGWSLSGILTGFAGSFAMLLGCRFMLGLFEAGNWPCGIRTTRAVLVPAERSFGNSLFQSGTAMGAVITPMVIPVILQRAEAKGESDLWRLPFQLIGSLGLVWILFWFVLVPKGMVNTLGTREKPIAHDGAEKLWDVLRDRRFWAVLSLVVAINITWHGYRTWMPLYLQNQRGYSESAMNKFSTIYYLVADIGAWTVGLATWGLCRLGIGIHRSRMFTIGICALLALCTLSVPFLPSGWVFQAGLLVVGFAALGLFPSYFALSQELSSRHQGKVTGMLGLVTHSSLAAIVYFEGMICKRTHSYEWVLGAVGIVPVLAFGLLLWLWPPRRERAVQVEQMVNGK